MTSLPNARGLVLQHDDQHQYSCLAEPALQGQEKGGKRATLLLLLEHSRVLV